MKSLVSLVAAAAAAVVLAVTASARATWAYTVASWYSAESTGSDRQGCAHAPALMDSALSVATFLVGCGQRLQICYGSRCVIAIRWDSGPYVSGRGIDLNKGTAIALFGSDASGNPRFGVGTVRWRPM